MTRSVLLRVSSSDSKSEVDLIARRGSEAIGLPTRSSKDSEFSQVGQMNRL